MEFKLKDEETTKKKSANPSENTPVEGMSGESELSGYVYNPVRISTTVPTPEARRNTSDSAVLSVIKWVAIIIILAVVAKSVMSFVKPRNVDVTNLVNKDAAEVEQALGVTFTKNSDMNTKINHYSKGKVTVDGGDGIGVVYIDGKYAGLHVDSKTYSMYGIKVGDGQTNAEKNMTFAHKDSLSVLDDMMKGNSTAIFYEGSNNGDCLVVIYNDHTNRVVAMTYFKDYGKVTENLSRLDE